MIKKEGKYAPLNLSTYTFERLLLELAGSIKRVSGNELDFHGYNVDNISVEVERGGRFTIEITLYFYEPEVYSELKEDKGE